MKKDSGEDEVAAAARRHVWAASASGILRARESACVCSGSFPLCLQGKTLALNPLLPCVFLHCSRARVVQSVRACAWLREIASLGALVIATGPSTCCCALHAS